MNHQKEDVLPAAAGLWPEIIGSLTNVPSKYFNGRNQPCPLCGGTDRARYIKKHDLPFHCNQCGPKSGIAFYMAYTGIGFADAINDVGNHLNMIPVDRREAIRRDYETKSKLPVWYTFDAELYDTIKKEASADLSAWQRVSGLNMIDMQSHDGDALIPLLHEDGKPFDFIIIDIEGDMKTTGGNNCNPSGSYSVFGEKKGKHTYIAVSPFTAAHSSVFMQRRVICCYNTQNVWDVIKNMNEPPVMIVDSVDDVAEADSLNLNQLTFNRKNNTVNRRIWEPGEIALERSEKNG